ncbi:MAG: hypothetical protein ABOK23_04685 [Candidatus Methanoperedens sp.]|nr:hypothetical protein [Candidatus Methanoperedens sp.]
MKFAKKCPKCGGNVQTKSIRKSIGLGFVNIPVAQFCLNPTCDWYQDFSEAKKPEELEETIMQVKIPVSKDRMAEIKKRTPGIIKENMMVVKGAIVVIILSILLIYALQFLLPQSPKIEAPETNAQFVNTTQSSGAVSTETPAEIQVMQEPKKYSVKMDVTHGFNPKVLTINRSDTIIWDNGENQRPRVALISKEGLFKDRLMEYSDKYPYQFNQSGNYTFVLGEYNPVNQNITEYPDIAGSVIVK